ncbi:unnamed protein product [Dicrocoelium dendriticum]|nr:unnamed protein product [Dicrocoelium dendriticum]
MAEPSQSACDCRHCPISKPESDCLCNSDIRGSFHSELSGNTSGICSFLSTNLTAVGQNTPALSRSDYSFSEAEPSLFDSLYSSQYTSEGHPSREPLAEIELVSIIQPTIRIPRYRLRVDPCTAFIGYKHKDFSGARRATHCLYRAHPLPTRPSDLTTIPSEEDLSGSVREEDHLRCISSSSTPEPILSSDEEQTPELTTEQIERTLDYFLLCGLRVSQMTRTYEDLDAITHLLEEKQNDLELAAKIGKTLLDKNQDLERRLSEAERKLILTEDTVNQLRHTLSIKDSLLQIYSRDHQDDSVDDHTTISSGYMSPLLAVGHTSDSTEGFSLASVNFTHLNRKVRELEEENFVLREERNRLNATADQLDEHESALIRDCARQLVSANMHIRTLSDELSRRSDAFLNQQSEVTRLLTRGLDLENKVKQLSSENDMLSSRLNESQLAQQRLSNELCQLRDKYDECMSLFTEARAEIRALRKRSRRAYLRSGCTFSPYSVTGSNSSASTPTVFHPLPCAFDQTAIPPSSFSSTQPDVSEGSSSSPDPTAQHSSLDGCSLASDIAWTARKEHEATNVDRLLRAMNQAHCAHDPNARAVTLMPPREYGPDDTVSSSGFVSGSEPSELVPHSTLGDNSRSREHHLLSAIPNTTCDDAFSDQLPDEQLKRHSWFGGDSTTYGRKTSFGIRAATHHNSLEETILPSDPSLLYGLSSFRSPQRLQLVKPLDGSEVLQQWQRLATPSFTRALFEAPLPGVQSRAGVPQSVDVSTPTQPQVQHSQSQSGPIYSTPLRSISSSCPAQDGNSHAGTLSFPSNESSSRFGANLPAHLTVDRIRCRSLESLRPSAHNLSHRFDAKGHRNPSEASVTSASSPFSISALVSAFLPFSLSFRNSSSENHSFVPSDDKQLSSEPVRIRPRSPLCSRGLLDVAKIGSDPSTSLQRVTTALQSSPSASTNLPSARPPPNPPSLYTRPPPPRTIRTSSLSGILEESGSPPKLDSSSAEGVTETAS